VDIGIDNSWISSPCPKCGYQFEFTFLQARLQETVICPCCKVNIRLTDSQASVEGAKREIDAAMRQLEDALKGLNRTIKIGL
jgi:hypothetical protein